MGLFEIRGLMLCAVVAKQFPFQILVIFARARAVLVQALSKHLLLCGDSSVSRYNHIEAISQNQDNCLAQAILDFCISIFLSKSFVAMQFLREIADIDNLFSKQNLFSYSLYKNVYRKRLPERLQTRCRKSRGNDYLFQSLLRYPSLKYLE